MELKVFSLLSTRSRRAMLGKKTPTGKNRYYIPRSRLMKRLKRELGLNELQILEQIKKERDFINLYDNLT